MKPTFSLYVFPRIRTIIEVPQVAHVPFITCRQWKDVIATLRAKSTLTVAYLS